MISAFIALNKHKSLIYATTSNTLRNRFTSSILGAAWLLLYPLIFLSMYSLVFVFILGIRMPGLDTAEYVLVIFSGLVPFLAFSEAFSIGSSSIIANRSLLRNTLFPIEMVVAKDVIVGHATMGLGLFLVWIAAVYKGHLYLTHLAIPIVFLLQILMTLGFVWLISSLVVFFRDIQQAIPIFILFLMLVSPIAYTDSMVPEKMKFFLTLNPLAWLMHMYRECFLTGSLPITDLFSFTFFCLLVLYLGYTCISKLKPIFVDYV